MLIDDAQLQVLAESLVAPLPDEATDDQKTARNLAISNTKAYFQITMKYQVDNTEIKGVKVGLDNGLNGIFTAGVPVPTDGGAVLQTAWKAQTLEGAKDKSTQNNDGKGLIL